MTVREGRVPFLRCFVIFLINLSPKLRQLCCRKKTAEEAFVHAAAVSAERVKHSEGANSFVKQTTFKQRLYNYSLRFSSAVLLCANLDVL